MTASGVGSEVRRRLLAAAEELLNQGGVITIEGTAERAGVARSTAYRHFAGRDDLFLELASMRSSRLLNRAMAIVTEGGIAAARLEDAFVFLFAEMPKDPVLAGLLADGAHGLETPAARQAAQDFLGALIAEGQASGEFRSDFPADEAVRWLVVQLVTAIQLFPAEDQTFRRWLHWFVLPALLSPAGNDAAAAAIATHLRKNAAALMQFADRIDPTAHDKRH